MAVSSEQDPTEAIQPPISMTVPPLTLPEMQSILRGLLAQEDSLIAEYQRTHEDHHTKQRNARTATCGWGIRNVRMEDKLLVARMKDLSMEIRDVAAKRRELLKEVRLVVPTST